MNPLPMDMLRRILLAGLLAASLVAQAPVFRTLDGRSGLPQSQVRALLEDRLGFLGVGTHGGVARLGASGIRSFGLPEGMGVGRVWGFLEDAEGGIWVAQEDANLALIRGNQVRVYGPSEGLEVPYAHALALDPQGRVLEGTRQGLWRLEGGRFSKVPLQGGWEAESIHALLVDRTGSLWMGSHAGRLARLGAEGVIQEMPLPEHSRGLPILGMGQYGSGEVFVATRTALMHLSALGYWNRESLEGVPEGAALEGFRLDDHGNLLVALGSDGLWCRDRNGRIQRWTTQEGLPPERVTTAWVDRRGTLWVGTDGLGLQALVIPGLSGLQRREAEPIGPVLTLLEDKKGTVWAGSSRGLFRIEEGRGLTGHWPGGRGLPGRDIRALAPEGPEGLWVGSNQGLVRWRGGRPVGPTQFQGCTVNQVIPWRGHVLVATNEGLGVLDRAGRESRFRLPPEMGGDLVYCILPGDRDVVLGTHRGLFTFDGRELRPLHREAPFAHLRVICLARDSAGALWVGTVRGLFREEGRGWASLGVPEGLPDSHLYFVQALPEGGMAIGHGGGVTLMDAKGGMVHLNQNLGLYSNETNRGCVLLDRSGRLWFGMVDGFCRLDLRQPMQPQAPTPPFVMEARWEGGEAFQPTDLHLPARVTSLQLEFEVGQPLCLQPPTFEVQMEGLGTGWQPMGRDHQMRFAGLEGGDYRFRVRASTDGLTWVEGPPLSLHVPLAWHQVLLGRLALVALLAGLLVAATRWRTHRLHAHAVELEQQVAERTATLVQRNLDLERAHAQVQAGLESKAAFTRMVAHDLRSPLTTLLLVAEGLEQELREGQGASRAAVLAQEAQRIEALLQRLLDQAKTDSFLQSTYRKRLSARQVLEGLPEVLRIKAQGRKLQFAFEEGETCAQRMVEVDPLGIQQVVLNLFGNALKFTEPGGQVGLRSRIEGAHWIMEVWDTGRGMDEAQVEHLFHPFRQGEPRDAAQGWGLGLGIVRALVEGHGGTIGVETTPGAGSTFRVELPLA